MNFFAVFVAFLIDQTRPLAHDNPLHRGMRAWARWVRHTFDAGQTHHGWVSWTLAAVLPAVLSAVLYLALLRLGTVLAFAWVVLVLYATLGFRQFSHHFTAIRDALEVGDQEAARAALAAWQRVDVGLMPQREIIRQVIEHSLVAAHRHVFGVLACFVFFSVLGLGPAGAVLYRMSEYLGRNWRTKADRPNSADLQTAAVQAWQWIDSLPARLTALCFAVVGNFEEAIASWRQDASRFPEPGDGVVLAAAAGAINVRLTGEALGGASNATDEAPSSPAEGREPQLAHLTSVVGLVWRAVVLWLLLMALLMLARVVG